ncbi:MULTISPECIES: hypothetical protein [unclassified Pseudonocardia]|uniref:hypothetical protein n=1 Tax=unclassified Pseudonocardia TaxID=2619320 RepID=UPI00094B1C51|nr:MULTISPECIES: hypothetical protein [unclassified Pseudonocardia]
MSDHELTVTVHVGSDPRRRERSAQDLRAALVDDPTIAGAGITVTRRSRQLAPDGTKSAIELVAAAGTLAVIGRWYVPHVADVLTTAIQAWCAQDRRMSVTLHDGDRSLTYTGKPDAAQRAVIERFFEGKSPTGADSSTLPDDGTVL